MKGIHVLRLSLFSDLNISQGSVAMPGGIFKNYFIANLPINLLVQEF